MELLQELLFSASLSLILAFLFSKIVSVSTADRSFSHRVPVSIEGEERSKAVELAELDGGERGSVEHVVREVEAVREIDVCEVEVSEESGAVDIDAVDGNSIDVRLEGEGKVVVEEIAVEEKEKEQEEEKEEERALFIEEEDWEGVERSELEKVFGVAMAFANSEVGVVVLSKLSSDVQMQLYGLQKVATEGPCYESQPLSLKVSARARWHAWQKLGNMDQEAAMEQYIGLLSDKVPGWMEGNPRVETECAEGSHSSDAGVSELVTPESSLEHSKQSIESKRKPEFN